MIDEVLRRVLNEIEKREMPLLSWGIYNGAFSEDELADLVGSVAPDADVDELIDALLERGLIATKGLAEERYRSRMAETVRLASSLRQWFYGHNWMAAPSLVSDARFLAQSRIVPRRDVTPDRLADILKSKLGSDWTPDHDRSMRAVLDGRSVSAFQARSMERLIDLGGQTGAGTVITAGTGSGKTLAFYLPALTRLLTSRGVVGGPQVVAIYPRIELLRDQLRALLLTGRTLASAGEQLPRVGVLYGATPHDRRDASATRTRGWKPQGSGLLCPILGCLEETARDRTSGRLPRGTTSALSAIVVPQRWQVTRCPLPELTSGPIRLGFCLRRSRW